MAHAQSVTWVASPTGNYRTRSIAVADPFSLLNAEPPQLIDEWQDAPGIWDAVRLEVDRRHNEAGQFILTGSVTPPKNATIHSGTGRIAHLSMWPMTLAEAGISSGVVSLCALFNGSRPPVVEGKLSEERLIETLIRGGWPA